MSDDAKTLHQKLLEVQRAVKYMQQDGEQKYGEKFGYVSSAQALASVRAKMDELGLLLACSVVEHTLHVEGAYTHKETKQHLTEIEFDFTWINVDAPDDRETFRWYGQGIDSGEKGVGKAATYAEKYFLLKFFHVATGKDDPDAFAADQEPPEPPAPPGEWLDDGRPADLKALAAALMDAGMSEKRVVPYAIRAGKSLGFEGAPPDWMGDQIADVYDEAKRMYEADIKDAQEAKST
jgi:hypothetical protein